MSQLTKFFITLAVMIYVISPIDLIPDFMVPFLGWIDDTVLISMLIYYLRTGKFPGIFSKKGSPNYGAGSFQNARNSQSTGRSQGAGDNSQQETFSGTRNQKTSQEDRTENKPRQTKSPHEILGISPDATREEIRTAYLNLAKQYHPDRVSHLGEEFQELAEKRFKEIQQAYATLSPTTSR